VSWFFPALESIHDLEPRVVTQSRVPKSVVAVPITGHAQPRETDEGRILRGKPEVAIIAQARDPRRDDLDDLHHILTDELQDERWDPNVDRIQKSLEIAFAYEAVVVPGIEGVEDPILCLTQDGDKVRIRLGRVDTTRDEELFAADGNWPNVVVRGSVLRFGNDLERGLDIN